MGLNVCVYFNTFAKQGCRPYFVYTDLAAPTGAFCHVMYVEAVGYNVPVSRCLFIRSVTSLGG